MGDAIPQGLDFAFCSGTRSSSTLKCGGTEKVTIALLCDPNRELLVSDALWLEMIPKEIALLRPLIRIDHLNEGRGG
ncbi:MAG: hypothetical protein H7832_13725 [Magnetococcus sp. DMHC-6]